MDYNRAEFSKKHYLFKNYKIFFILLVILTNILFGAVAISMRSPIISKLYWFCYLKVFWEYFIY